MNERIKKIAEQVGITEANLSDGNMSYAELEKFGELFIRECADFLKQGGDYEDANRLKRHFGIEE